jgi:hypothetical protein
MIASTVAGASIRKVSRISRQGAEHQAALISADIAGCALSRAASRWGGAPNRRAYSRLNCWGLE